MSTSTTPAPPSHEAATTTASARGRGLVVLFSVTSFLGAFLSFMVQPMAAKLVLPSYGGAATVWSTSSLFFQVILLGGYIYAHVSTQRLGRRWQPRVHLLVLALPLLVLPVALPSDPAPGPGDSPIVWLLRTLILLIGLPFLVLTTTSPLIQRWYAWSDGPRSQDPYFLFAGSNLGSFAGLLAYPLVVEPLLTTDQQRVAWSLAFAFFLALMATCAFTVRGLGQGVAQTSPSSPRTARPGLRTLAGWCLVAFLPSTLMLSSTAHLSTDVASVPLLWVLPLAAYLLSFVAAFARTSRDVPRLAIRLAAFSSAACLVVSIFSIRVPVLVTMAVEISTVALVSYAAHALLAARRPHADHLTLFYIVISLGGAFGGLLNGVAAPLLFNRVWEHSLTLACVPLLLLAGATVARPTRWRLPLPGPAASLLPLLVCITAGALTPMAHGASPVLAVVTGAVALIALWAATSTPVPVTVALLLFSMAAGTAVVAASHESIRTFYGSYRVASADDMRTLVHGTTVHGTQFLDASKRAEPTAYYSRSGPLGDVFDVVSPQAVTAVGLGIGTLAAYSEPGSSMTFIEIDQAVVDIARDERYFHFLADARGDVDVLVGDGRLLLSEIPDASSDLIVLDAFSSDSIPTHLLTEEALTEFATATAPGTGALAIHISNRHLDLAPVLASHAQALGWQGVVGVGGDGDGAVESTWVVITPHAGVAQDLVQREGWSQLAPETTVRWTDNYSSLLNVLE